MLVQKIIKEKKKRKEEDETCTKMFRCGNIAAIDFFSFILKAVESRFGN